MYYKAGKKCKQCHSHTMNSYDSLAVVILENTEDTRTV